MSESLLNLVAAYFRAHPNQDVDAQAVFLPMAGYGGWRSRVSECRTKLGMDIPKPRVVTVQLPDGRTIRKSFYRYVPRVERPTIEEATGFSLQP